MLYVCTWITGNYFVQTMDALAVTQTHITMVYLFSDSYYWAFNVHSIHGGRV